MTASGLVLILDSAALAVAILNIFWAYRRVYKIFTICTIAAYTIFAFTIVHFISHLYTPEIHNPIESIRISAFFIITVIFNNLFASKQLIIIQQRIKRRSDDRRARERRQGSRREVAL
jgi:hypothetical protein